jgi:molybdate transport system substrate-binding protein
MRHRPAGRAAVLSGLVLVACSGLAGAEDTGTGELTVFAAASLQAALGPVAADWQAATGQAVVTVFAGTAALARQIEEGAPADIYIAASADWMDRLEAGGHILPDTRIDLLGNSLVLVAPAGPGSAAPAPVELTAGTDLPALLDGGRLSMALVDSVPAGIYGRQALERLGLWHGLAGLVVQSDNVSAALRFVTLGEAPLGIVYASDAVSEPAVAVVATFPPDSHDPIIYPAAVTAASDSPDAEPFLQYLASDAASPVFSAYGFAVLSAAPMD